MPNDKRLRNLSLILGILGGLLLLLGAVVVVLWMSQGKATAKQPWELKPARQMQYIRLLAQDYAQSRDISRAKEALNGWDTDKLADLFAMIELQTTDVETLKQLANLRDALSLPAPLLGAASLFRLDSLLPIAGLALLFLAMAALVVLWPNKKPSEEESEAEEAAATVKAAAAEATAEGLAEQAAEDNPEAQEQQQQEGQQGEASGQPGQGPAPQEAEGLQQLAAPNSEEVQGIFSSLLEEEEENSEDLALLARGLQDMEIAALAAKAEDVLQQLYEAASYRRR